MKEEKNKLKNSFYQILESQEDLRMKYKLYPYILNFDRCNQNCIFCMKSYDLRKRKKLSYREASKLIIKAKESGYARIDFFGGEPTCFGFLKKAIKLTNKFNMIPTLATNAINFSSKAYTANFFKGIYLYAIRTSLHSHKSEVHDAITRVKESFILTVRGIKNILMYHKRLGVNIVITKLNYKDIIDTVRYVKELGVEEIKFSDLVLEGSAINNDCLKVDIEVVLPLLIKALKYAKEIGFSRIEVEKFPRHIFKKRDFEFVHFLGSR